MSFKPSKNISLQIICALWVTYMIGCTTLRALLVFYAASTFKMQQSDAIFLYSTYSSIYMFIGFMGGWLAVNLLGFRLAVQIGLLLYGIGIYLISLSQTNLLYLGLGTMATGAGVFSPNMNSILNTLFKVGDFRRNAVFTVTYTTMNIGGVVGYFLAGSLSKFITLAQTYEVAGITVIIGAILSFIASKQIPTMEFPFLKKILGILLLIAISLLITFLLHHYIISSNLITFLALTIIAGLFITGIRQRLKSNHSTLLKYTGLGLISFMFYSLYQIKVSLLNFYIDEYAARTFFSFAIPAPFFQSLNPIFVISFGPLLAIFWLQLEKRQYTIKTANKFLIALFLIGLSYLGLAIGHIINPTHPVNLTWITCYFLLISLGELIITPAGYATIGELFHNDKSQGLYQGLWSIFRSAGDATSAMIAVKLPLLIGIHNQATMTINDDTHLFLLIGLAACIISLAAYLRGRA